MNRRGLIKAFTAASLLGFTLPAYTAPSAKVIIIGGGFGGASAAMHLRRVAPAIDVTLIEKNTRYTTCPFSNLVIAGSRDMAGQYFDYEGLRQVGIRVIIGEASDIEAENRQVKLKDGQTFAYDRLILSPGIDMIWDAIEGYDYEAAQLMPHAWKAGPQTLLLKRQIEAMEDGGTVVISVPPAPFRCPPGPYERASLIAHYLKTHKPRSKLLILDAQDTFSKKPLFEAAWAANYTDIIERIPSAESGRVIRVDPTSKILFTDFDAIKADVANVIPPQHAGIIAQISGLTNASGWCPIDAKTFESQLHPNIHVIGDATIAAPMPKSAFSANLQGKICAAQIVRLLAGQAPIETTLTNTCYSYSDPENAFSVSGVYNTNNGTFQPVQGAGGTSPIGDDPALRSTEAAQAQDWFHAITREAFGRSRA